MTEASEMRNPAGQGEVREVEIQNSNSANTTQRSSLRKRGGSNATR